MIVGDGWEPVDTTDYVPGRRHWVALRLADRDGAPSGRVVCPWCATVCIPLDGYVGHPLCDPAALGGVAPHRRERGWNRPLRVLISGWRELEDPTAVWWSLGVELARVGSPQNIVVVHGAARGVDAHAEAWATMHGVRSERHPARWKDLGKKAGPVRNQEMVEAGADLALTFPGPGSVGTWDLIRRAASRRIPTVVIHVS